MSEQRGGRTVFPVLKRGGSREERFCDGANDQWLRLVFRLTPTAAKHAFPFHRIHFFNPRSNLLCLYILLAILRSVLLTRAQAAEFLGIGPQTLAAWAVEGKTCLSKIRGHYVRDRLSDLRRAAGQMLFRLHPSDQ